MSEKKPRKLHDGHRTAIGLMVQGIPDVHVARNVGIASETLSRWKKKNKLFMEELERQRARIKEVIQERQLELAFKALEVVEENLLCSDRRAAIDFLKIVNKEVLAKSKVVGTSDELRSDQC